MGALRASLDNRQLSRYVSAQVNNAFPDGAPVGEESLLAVMPHVMQRVEHCFSRIDNAYFFDGRSPVFDHLHGDQYAMFLYLACNTVHRSGGDRNLAAKIFLLNKTLHGIDAYYEVELPDIFLFVHPLGTVLGRGRYSNYLTVYQRCGVGSNHDVYPHLGEFCTLHPGASVYGASRIGDNCTVAAESYVLDADLGDGQVYFGEPRNFTTRTATGTPPIWRTGDIPV